MTLDPAIAQLVAGVERVDPATLPIDVIRSTARSQTQALAALGVPEVGRIADVSVPGPAGSVPTRVYAPIGETSSPPLAFVHGGGWIAGDLDTHDDLARRLCSRLGCQVVSVDYRLAPENPFPAALEDCLAVVEWLASQRDLAPDGRVLLAGDSAGGNLVALVSAQLREDPRRPVLAQLLLYPAVDLAPDRSPLPSWLADTDPLLTVDVVRFCIDAYLQGQDPGAASPLRGSVDGLPPTVVVTAEVDPLRDQGRAYADRLVAEGVPAVVIDGPGMLHGFAGMAGLVPAAAAVLDQALATFADIVAARVS